MTNQPDRDKKGIAFNIQKYSLHDGPGIRTIIFLKGCPLRCDWCSNPESQALHRQLAYNRDKCLTVGECSRCRGVCPRGALSNDAEGKIVRDSTACDDCLDCASVCPTCALSVYGYEISVDDALDRVEEDDVFYARSGGGLTLSGGEPLMQEAFTLALLAEARRRRIDTAMETCGHGAWSTLEKAARVLNSIHYDIKTMDSDRHLEGTGVSNELILENFTRLRHRFPNLPVTVRTPVIPGFNDGEEQIAAIVDFIARAPGVEYELLAYHRLGTPKYGYIDRECPMAANCSISNERMDGLREFARLRMKACRSTGPTARWKAISA